MAQTMAPTPEPPARRRPLVLQTIPRQHGAWSVLLLSYALGVAGAGRFTAGSLLLLVSLMAVMPARHTAGLWWRLRRDDARRGGLAGWTALYALLAVGPALALVGFHGMRWLVPLGAVGAGAGLAMLLLERTGRDRTLGAETLGMVGLSLAVPAAYGVSNGACDGRAAGLWALAAVMFCGGVLHVRHVLGRLGGGPAAAFHAAAVLLAVAASLVGLLPSWAWVALAPALVRAVWPLLRPGRTPPAVQRLGFQELAYGALFVVLSVLAFRL